MGTAAAPQPRTLTPSARNTESYAMYESMRAEAPLHRIVEPSGLERWLIVSYEEARAALHDERLSKDPRHAWDALAAAGYVSGDPNAREGHVFHLANTDPPEHTRLRKLAMKALSLRRIESARPMIERVVEGLLDDIAPRGTVDLMSEFCIPVPFLVICGTLGVPNGDRATFRAWTTSMLTPRGFGGAPMSQREAWEGMREFVFDLLESKRPHVRLDLPDDDQPDVVSSLIAARDGEHKLSDQELVALVMLLVSAGQEPTSNLLANGTLALLQNPDQLALLAQRPDLVDSAVEEFLRYDGPVEFSTTRVAKVDLEIGGIDVPAGSIITLAIASADRDPDAFDDADRLDITRAENAHLAFGHGIHYCVGAPLARLQAQVAFPALLRRLPGITLDCPAEELTWRSTRIMRSLTALPVRFTPTTGD